MARPSTFKQETADLICTRLMEGESLRSICQDDKMPGQRTVYQWLNDKPEFQQQYARAREVQADRLAEEILEIADDSARDTYEDEDGNQRTDHEVVARSRLRVDSRKWLASKMAPKKYGDKVELSGTGAGGAIQIERIEYVVVDPK